MYWIIKKKKKEESLKKRITVPGYLWIIKKKKIRKMCRACSFLYKIFLIKDCFANKVLLLLLGLHVSLTISYKTVMFHLLFHKYGATTTNIIISDPYYCRPVFSSYHNRREQEKNSNRPSSAYQSVDDDIFEPFVPEKYGYKNAARRIMSVFDIRTSY